MFAGDYFGGGYILGKQVRSVLVRFPGASNVFSAGLRFTTKAAPACAHPKSVEGLTTTRCQDIEIGTLHHRIAAVHRQNRTGHIVRGAAG